MTFGLFGKRRAKQVDMAQFTPVPEAGYLVGGALRDSLLGRSFSDTDWVVPDPVRAARDAAEALGGSAFPLDETRGHWRVVADEQVIDYSPLETDIETNLRQRDFTVNALVASPTGEILDPLDAQADLRRKRLRMVSPEGLVDDPLRPLRAVRLCAELSFDLEAETEKVIKDCAQRQLEGGLALPAWERIGEELNKLIFCKRAGAGFAQLEALGLLTVYLPELAKARATQQGGFHHLDVLGHSLEALNQLVQGFPEADLSLRWATLLHDVGKPDTKTYDESGKYYHFYGHDKLGAELTAQILRRLRHSSDVVKQAAALVRYHMVQLPKTEKSARRFVHRRRELLPDLLKLMIADREAARGPLSSEASRQRYRLALAKIVALLEQRPPKPPLFTGRDVMALLELNEGPLVGEAVRFIREAEAVGDVTTREEAERALKTYALKQGWTELSDG